MMTVSAGCWVIISLFVAQAPSEGSVAAREVVTLTLRDGTTLAGAILSERGNVLSIELDTPWQPEIRKIPRSEIVAGPELEREGARMKRYRDAGYERVNTLSGVLFVHKDQRDYARRAQRMADTLAEQRKPVPDAEADGAETAASAEPTDTREAPPGTAGFRYWPQVAVGVVALVLMGVILKFLVL